MLIHNIYHLGVFSSRFGGEPKFQEFCPTKGKVMVPVQGMSYIELCSQFTRQNESITFFFHKVLKIEENICTHYLYLIPITYISQINSSNTFMRLLARG